MRSLGDQLYRLARRPLAGQLLRWVFANMSFAIPVKRLRETDTLVAFYHPRPSYAVHILLVSRRPYRTILDVPTGDTEFVADLLDTVRDLVGRLDLGDQGYRLIVNGGAYQEAQLLHFHLVSGPQHPE